MAAGNVNHGLIGRITERYEIALRDTCFDSVEVVTLVRLALYEYAVDALVREPEATDVAPRQLLELLELRLEVAGLREQLAAMDVDNAALATELSHAHARVREVVAMAAAVTSARTVTWNGNGTAEHELAVNDPSPWPAGWLALLDDETRAMLAELDAGRRDWARVDLRIRRALVLWLVAQLAEDGALTIASYNQRRPAWSPGANNMALVMGLRWSEVVEQAVSHYRAVRP